MTKLSAPRAFAVPVSFLRKHDYLTIELGPDLIRLKEPYARRWLNYPLSRLYIQACDLESQENHSTTQT